MDQSECKSKGGKWENGTCYVPEVTIKKSSSFEYSSTKRATWPMLIVSIIIDAVGCISYLVPGIGEMIDVAWAPISAVILYMMYGQTFGSLIQALEELAPGTDIIPTATLLWFYNFMRGN